MSSPFQDIGLEEGIETTSPPTWVPWTPPPQERYNDMNIRKNNLGDLNGGLLQTTGGLVTVVALVAAVMGIFIGVSTVYCTRYDYYPEDEELRGDKRPSSIPGEILDTSHVEDYYSEQSTITDI